MIAQVRELAGRRYAHTKITLGVVAEVLPIISGVHGGCLFCYVKPPFPRWDGRAFQRPLAVPTVWGYRRGNTHTPLEGVGRRWKRFAWALEEALESLNMSAKEVPQVRQNIPFPFMRRRPECLDFDFAAVQKAVHGVAKFFLRDAPRVRMLAENGRGVCLPRVRRHIAAFAPEFR